MLLNKTLVALSLLVIFSSAQAQMTDSGSHNDRFWNTGISGTFGPGTNMNFHPGVIVGWSSDIRKYNIGTDLRFTWPRDDAPHPELGSAEAEYGFIFWSLTMRYFFSNRSNGNVAPVVGAGISLGTIYGDNGWADGSKVGFGAHVTFGIEMLRLAKSRLRLEMRTDFPFFKPNLSDTYRGEYRDSSGEYRVYRGVKAYLVPMTIGISYHR